MNPTFSTTKSPDKSKSTDKLGAVKQRQDVAKELSTILADTYTAYLKTQNYHWNITGPLFGTLHRIFDEQYHELADAIDKIAERIRAIGSYAPATYRQFQELSDVNEAGSGTDIPEDIIMAQNLAGVHDRIASKLRQSIRIAEQNQDVATADLLIKRCRTHDKYAWMLRSFQRGEPAENSRARH